MSGIAGRARFRIVCGAAVAIAVAAPANAGAKAKPITGKLDANGYTVIAVAGNLVAKTDNAPKGKFSLRPPAKTVSLHLRGPDGQYAGPVVLGKREGGNRAVVGVDAGADLGKIAVNAGKGYAKVKKPPKDAIADGLLAKAKNGVPIGAGDFGLVKSKPPKKPPAGDLDLDGIPGSLDIDDDGDLVLDDYDSPSPKTKAAKLAADGSSSADSNVLTGVQTGGELTGLVNANGGSTDAQIAAFQQEYERMGFTWELTAGPGNDPIEIDCGALVYCSPGGSGQLVSAPVAGQPSGTPQDFPECCDDDGDGFGLWPQDGSVSLKPNATDDQLRAGDVVIMHGTVDGQPVESAKGVSFVYSTVPVLASYSDGQGNAGSFTYPRTPCPPAPAGNPCPSPVRAGPSGDAVLRLEFWRPQRRHLDGDPGEGRWMDVGHLSYAVQAVSTSGGVPGSKMCPESAYSDLDPGFVLDASQQAQSKGQVRWVDPTSDVVASPSNTFGLTLNLTQCLAANGISQSAGTTAQVNLWAFQYSSQGPGMNFTQTSSQFALQP
jgi:hypothetical protein